jgi:predicted SnoaL-like aldol condensation-catalyzing enzyme
MSADDNKALVTAFYEQAFNDYQPEQAAKAHLGDSYTQHNPGAQDGP